MLIEIARIARRRYYDSGFFMETGFHHSGASISAIMRSIVGSYTYIDNCW